LKQELLRTLSKLSKDPRWQSFSRSGFKPENFAANFSLNESRMLKGMFAVLNLYEAGNCGIESFCRLYVDEMQRLGLYQQIKDFKRIITGQLTALTNPQNASLWLKSLNRLNPQELTNAFAWLGLFSLRLMGEEEDVVPGWNQMIGKVHESFRKIHVHAGREQLKENEKQQFDRVWNFETQNLPVSQPAQASQNSITERKTKEFFQVRFQQMKPQTVSGPFNVGLSGHGLALLYGIKIGTLNLPSEQERWYRWRILREFDQEAIKVFKNVPDWAGLETFDRNTIKMQCMVEPVASDIEDFVVSYSNGRVKPCEWEY
jgi:hypothetical protein